MHGGFAYVLEKSHTPVEHTIYIRVQCTWIVI